MGRRLSIIIGLIIVVFLFMAKTSPAAAGDVLYFEDFSKVQAGYLPGDWAGGEKLMVKEDRGKKYLGIFEVQEKHSVTIKNIRYPRNYEIRFIALHAPDPDFEFASGSAQFGIYGGPDSYKLNKSELQSKERFDGKTVTLIFRKKDQILSLQVDGNEAILVRDPNFKYSDTFSFSISLREMDAKVYEIKMTDLGD